MILENETFEKFGYYPSKLGKYSEKRIVAKCDGCGKIREMINCSYSQLCKFCAATKRFSELNEEDIKVNREMTQVLEEETYRNFGYYPSELKPKSGKRILVKCKNCGEIREITKSAYHELCMSCSRIGRYFSEETREKLRKANLGKRVSDETRKKLHDSHMGFHPTEETREKLRKAHGGKNHHFYGKHLSEEHKQKLSEARIGRFGDEKHPMFGKHHTKEAKEKISKSRKGQNCGVNHHNWKGGISTLNFLETHGISTTEWEKIAKIVRKRDNHICQYCGEGNSYIVHHIIPRNIEIDNSLENLITLCTKCHPKVEALTNKYLKKKIDPILIFYKKWSEINE